MPIDLALIGGVLFVLAAVISYGFAIRALQSGRRLANYHHRQLYISQARRSFVISGLLMGVVALLVILGRISLPQSFRWLPFLSQTPTPPAVAFQPQPTLATGTPTLQVQSSPASFVVTPSPASSLTFAPSPAPSIPMPILAQFRSVITPQSDAKVSRLRFATEIRDSQPVGPSTRFHNPIGSSVFATFFYGQMTPGVQWTVLWYRDGEFLTYETKTWSESSSGIGFIEFEQPARDWLPGVYEVQLFIGSQWKASGSFTLIGDPPTVTPTSTLTPTVSSTPASPPSSTSTRTPTPTATPALTPSRTPLPTGTFTESP